MKPALSIPRDDILQQALALDAADREFLVDELERSLPMEKIDDEVAEAWSREIDRRIAAYDRGETTAFSFEASLAHIRQALDEHRSKQAAP